MTRLQTLIWSTAIGVATALSLGAAVRPASRTVTLQMTCTGTTTINTSAIPQTITLTNATCSLIQK